MSMAMDDALGLNETYRRGKVVAFNERDDGHIFYEVLRPESGAPRITKRVFSTVSALTVYGKLNAVLRQMAKASNR